MDNVVELEMTTTLDIPVERVCEAAKELETVVIVGVKDGEYQLRSSQGEIADVLLHLMKAQGLVMEHIDG